MAKAWGLPPNVELGLAKVWGGQYETGHLTLESEGRLACLVRFMGWACSSHIWRQLWPFGSFLLSLVFFSFGSALEQCLLTLVVLLTVGGWGRNLAND